MRFSAWLCAAATALLAAAPLPARGFAPVRPLCSLSRARTARSNPPTVPPLRRHDRSPVLSKGGGAEEKEPPPRGVSEIVLNTAVGGLVFAGGVMGYVKKGSKASLISGSTFGGLLMLSAYLISKKNPIGNRLGSGVSGLLMFVMGKKYKSSGRFFPAGLVAGLGAIAFLYNSIETLIDLGGQSAGENDSKDD